VIQGSTWDQSGNPSTVGLVLTTGPDTEKGKMVAGILFQEPARFKFDVQVKFVVLYLLLYACFMFWLTCYFLAEDPIYAWFYGMYVVGTAMPPLLPSVFILSVGIAASRLRFGHHVHRPAPAPRRRQGHSLLLRQDRNPHQQ
jgi:cation-transporting ATPase 13A3/4/5